MRKVAILIGLFLLISGCATGKQNIERLSKLDKDHFKNTMTIKDDELEVDVEFNTQKGFVTEIGAGGNLLVGMAAGVLSKGGKSATLATDYFLRAFLNKNTGKKLYQVCCSVEYTAHGWRFYRQANFGRPLMSVKAHKVGSDVDCSGKGNCKYKEQIVFEVPEKEFQRASLEYDPDKQEIQFWPFKLKSQSGEDLRGNIALQEIAALLETVENYKPI